MRSHSEYVPLHLHTEYSLLDGAIKIDELVKVASEFRLPALAITDHGNIFGAIEFYEKVSKAGIKPIIGAEVYVAPESRFKKHTERGSTKDSNCYLATKCGENAYHLILLAKDISGYKNLMRLLTLAHLEGFYYKPRIDNDLLEQYSGGLIALSSCMKGEIPLLLLKGDIDGARRRALYYKNLFGPENFYIELQANGIPEQEELNKRLALLAEEIHVGVVATNDCHYLRREDAKAHEILLCIQTNKTINDTDRMRFPTDEFYFKSPDEMMAEFSSVPEAIRNTVRIAERCNLTLELGKPLLPEFSTPDGSPPEVFLERISIEGLKRRFRDKEIPENYRKRLHGELQMIKKMGYSSYFLIVWDFIRFAKERDIPVGPGRGSAAGSLVAWALGITEIDPIRYSLLFERFLNPERVSMPDIDVDFCRDRREEVIRYVQEKYGVDQVAQIITFGTMASRAAVRDTGRVLGMPYQEVDRIAKLIPVSATKEINLKTALELSPPLKESYEKDPKVKGLIDIAMKLEGLKRHASVHAAGVVIAPEPLTEYTALYKGSKGDETITTQFDLEALEKVGLIKFDFLGLDTLTIIDRTVKYIKEKERDFDLNQIPLDDKETYRLLSEGRTAGIFQLEGSGMRELLMKLQPDRFDDLIALVALYRPGPLGSGMVDDFIKRKKGLVPVEYDLPELKDILDETYGVILYQEQVMRISNVIAGFSMGQADLLRRAISKKDPILMEEMKEKFIRGALERGYSEEVASRLFGLIEYFGNYGFNKSHSAAYALLAYQTAYLKTHYPVEFMAASLSAEVNKTEKIIRLINECDAMGVRILPPDINKSSAEFTIEDGAIRFGLKAVKGVGVGAISAITEERDKRPFESLEDFLKRMVDDPTNCSLTTDSGEVTGGLTGGNECSPLCTPEVTGRRRLSKKVIEALIKAGAFDSFGISRQEALQILESPRSRKSRIQPSMFDAVEEGSENKKDFSLVPSPPIGFSPDTLQLEKKFEWNQAINLAYEKEALGFYISGHPLQPFREILRIFGVKEIEELKTKVMGIESVTSPLSVVKVTDEEGQYNEDLLGWQSNGEEGLGIDRSSTVTSPPSTVCFIAGLVLDIKRHRTRERNELMAFVTLEDEFGTVEMVVFPELYKASMSILEKGSLVVIRGKADLSEKGLKIIAEELWDLETFIRNGLNRCSRLNIHLELFKTRKEDLMRLIEIIREDSSGEATVVGVNGGEGNSYGEGLPLYIELLMPDCTVSIQSRFRVNPDFRVIKRIQELLGRNSVEVIC